MKTPEIITIVCASIFALACMISVVRFFFRNAGCLFALLAVALACVALLAPYHNAICWIGAGVCLLLSLATRAKPKSNQASGSKPKARRKSSRVVHRGLEAFAAAVESGEAEIDANIRAVFADVSDELENIADAVESDEISAVVRAKSEVVRRIGTAKVSGSQSPVVNNLSELSDLIEERRTSLDATTRAALLDVYDFCEVLSNEVGNGDGGEAASDLACDLERAIFPMGLTEKQAYAAAERQSKIRLLSAKTPAMTHEFFERLCCEHLPKSGLDLDLLRGCIDRAFASRGISDWSRAKGNTYFDHATQRQLDFLASMGWPGKRPRYLGEASCFIETALIIKDYNTRKAAHEEKEAGEVAADFTAVWNAATSAGVLAHDDAARLLEIVGRAPKSENGAALVRELERFMGETPTAAECPAGLFACASEWISSFN
jgi:hypothetical protein